MSVAAAASSLIVDVPKTGRMNSALHDIWQSGYLTQLPF
jgi:hypothetical protein